MTKPNYYEYTIETFGPDRCMFESNFPVDAVGCSYVVLWNSFKRLTAGCSPSEKAKLFHDTAARVYRLWRPSGARAHLGEGSRGRRRSNSVFDLEAAPGSFHNPATPSIPEEVPWPAYRSSPESRSPRQNDPPMTPSC